MPNSKTILVAPLHWGLGHATRCIPLINALIEANYKVLLASDGAALLLLRKEFPNVSYLELPSYDISYPKNGEYFKWKMLWKLPHIRKAIASEKKIIKKLVTNGSIDGIISDNRLGVSSENVPSAFITHQLNVLSGNTSYFSSKIHQRFIKKFNECWVPDVKGAANLSGKLGHIENAHFPIKYMGIISRFQKKELPLKYDILALLSGPEPQRSLFEEIIIEQLKGQDKKVLLVRGVIIDTQEKTQFENITIVNFMQSEELGNSINESEVIVARSGYTTILDLAALKKKAFFIPTPGQYEQNYLANRLKSLGLAPSCKQESFRIDKLCFFLSVYYYPTNQ
jgi:predicted glycosyltransferase